jgi:hypothetical protein
MQNYPQAGYQAGKFLCIDKVVIPVAKVDSLAEDYCWKIEKDRSSVESASEILSSANQKQLG